MIATDYIFGKKSAGAAAPGGVLDGQIQGAFTIENSILSLYKSEDFGDSFIGTQPFPGGYAVKQGVISSDGQTIATCDGSRIIISRDGGQSFSLDGYAGTVGVAISDDVQIISRCTSAGVFVSNDGGNTWAQTLSGVNIRFISSSANGQYQLATGYYAPYVSSDYGQTWTQTGVSRTYQANAVSSNGKFMIACAYNTPLAYSSDYGQTWTDKGPAQQLYTCSISNNGQHIIMGGNTYIRVSNNGGMTFQDRVVTVSTWMYSAISGSGKYMMIANTNTAQVYKSNDYGETWATFGAANNWRAVVINRVKQDFVFPTSGLVAYYKMNELAGATTAVDSHAGENLPLYAGLTRESPGMIGTGFYNSGNGHKMVGGGCTPITGHFTVNTWVYRTGNGTGANNVIVQQGDYGSGFGIWMGNTGQLSYRINSSYGGIFNYIIPLNEWTMITYFYDGSITGFYINGGLGGYRGHTTNPSSATTRRFFTRANSGEAFVGRQDECGFWNRALTAEEVAALYNDGFGLTL